MKRLLPILLLLLSCTDEVPEARVAATCQLVRIEQPRENEVSLRDEISYSNGKLNQSYYYTKQATKLNWDYVERRDYIYTEDGMDITITRPAFTINGSFVLNSQGNLIEYSDDYFFHVFRYEYDGNNLASDDKIRYIVRNSNIVERIDVQTGNTIDRFTYDDHPNPLKNLFYEPIRNDVMAYFRFYNSNNVLTETNFNPDGTRTVIRYSYEYNSEGYPTKQTSSGRVTQYTYKCE